MEAVTLHRCPFKFLKSESHGCHQVQLALDRQGIDYTVATSVAMPRSLRKRLQKATGQGMMPAIEFSDGSSYRAESKEMVSEIAAGRLFEHRS